MPGIGKQPNIFDSIYFIIKSITSAIYKIIGYIIFFVFVISDYLVEFACNILTIGVQENVKFPGSMLMYGFVIVRTILLVYGFKFLFEIIFDYYAKLIFTRGYTLKCNGNVNNVSGYDNKPLCQTVSYEINNPISASKSTTQYNFQRFDNAKNVCVKQIALWLICLNLFVIPATFKT